MSTLTRPGGAESELSVAQVVLVHFANAAATTRETVSYAIWRVPFRCRS